jgi:hypothetical protein
MSNNPDGLVQLLQVLLLLLGQHLTPRRKGFVHPICTGETDDWTCDALVDPCERNMAHLPIVLLCNLFNTRNDLLVTLSVTRGLVPGLLFAFGTGGRAKCGGRASEMATAKRCPLLKRLAEE